MHFVQSLGIQLSCSCQNAKANEVAQVAEVTLVWMANIYAVPSAYPSVSVLRISFELFRHTLTIIDLFYYSSR